MPYLRAGLCAATFGRARHATSRMLAATCALLLGYRTARHRAAAARPVPLPLLPAARGQAVHLRSADRDRPGRAVLGRLGPRARSRRAPARSGIHALGGARARDPVRDALLRRRLLEAVEPGWHSGVLLLRRTCRACGRRRSRSRSCSRIFSPAFWAVLLAGDHRPRAAARDRCWCSSPHAAAGACARRSVFTC